MTRRLPSFPRSGTPTYADLHRLVQALELQLLKKADNIEGKTYGTDDQPIMIIDDDGNELRLGKDVIPPMMGATDLTDYVTQEQIADYPTTVEADEAYQPKGNYQPAGDYATQDQLDTVSAGLVTRVTDEQVVCNITAAQNVWQTFARIPKTAINESRVSRFHMQVWGEENNGMCPYNVAGFFYDRSNISAANDILGLGWARATSAPHGPSGDLEFQIVGESGQNTSAAIQVRYVGSWPPNVRFIHMVWNQNAADLWEWV